MRAGSLSCGGSWTDVATRARADARRADIQGLRALAVLLVVAYHSGLSLPGGFVGVDVFFVVSGFVITAMLLRELTATGTLRLGRFYKRRARRLLPALAVILSVTAVLSALLQSPLGMQQDTAATGIAAGTWMANGVLYLITGGYFDNSADSIPLLHTWSLSVEEQFYVLFPTMLLVAWLLGRRLSKGLAVSVLILCVIFVASLVLSIWFSYGGRMSKASNFAFYSSPTRAWEFAAGALLALWAARERPRPIWMATAVAICGAIGLGASAVFITSAANFPGIVALGPVAATIMLIAAGTMGSTVISRLLSTRPMVAIGDLSYSWYLWHWPLIVFAGLLWPFEDWTGFPAGVIALLPAWLSYRFVEEPIRHGRVAIMHNTPLLVVTCVAIPILLLLGLYLGANRSWGNEQIAEMARQVTTLPVGYREGCHSELPLPARDLSRCTWNAGASGMEVMLIGDSNAAQYAGAVIRAGEQIGRRVIIATMSACPFVDVELIRPDAAARDRACRTFVTGTTEGLRHQRPAVIVTASANEMITEPTVALRDPYSNELADSPAAKYRVWRDGLTRTFKALRDAGHSVLLVNVVPHFADGDRAWWHPSKCDHPTQFQNPSKCGRAMSLQVADRLQELALGAERSAAAQVGIQELPLRHIVCPDRRCFTNVGNFWVYRDGLHLSTAASAALSARFAAAIQRVPERPLGNQP